MGDLVYKSTSVEGHRRRERELSVAMEAADRLPWSRRESRIEKTEYRYTAVYRVSIDAVIITASALMLQTDHYEDAESKLLTYLCTYLLYH